MNMKKLGFALSLTAAFGLMACESSSSASSDNSDSTTPTCKVTSDASSVTTTITKDGATITTTASIDGKFVVSTTTFTNAPQDEIDAACAEEKADDENVEVNCDGKTITAKTNAHGATVALLKTGAEYTCKAIESGKLNLDEEEEEEDLPEQQNQSGDGDDNQGGKTKVDDDQGSEDPSDDDSSVKTNPDEDDDDDSDDIGFNLGDLIQTCENEGETKTESTFLGIDIPMICQDGYWQEDEETIETLTYCETEGATKDTLIANKTITLTCEENEWTMSDEDAEEMMKCDNEGEKQSLQGMPLICKEGKWDVDLEAMGLGDLANQFGDLGDLSLTEN